MLKTPSRVPFKYMNHCPVDGKPLGQTKICPEHKQSKATFLYNVTFSLKPIFVDPAMA